MQKYPIRIRYRQQLADTLTPVSAYLRLRDHFAGAILLESSDYHGRENHFSFIGLEPMAGVTLENDHLRFQYPDGSEASDPVKDLVDQLRDYLSAFEAEIPDLPFPSQGFFGYFSYDAVRHFEDLKITKKAEDARRIPEVRLHLYRYLLVFDHFHNRLTLCEVEHAGTSRLDAIRGILDQQSLPRFGFSLFGEEQRAVNDGTYLAMVENAVAHCQRGDVFQLVLSRAFSQEFRGDEFNVYRQLRSVNPSPYLFFCDYGSYKLFGSSPEAQLQVSDGRAEIHPIAGTFRRTGEDEADQALARKLAADPKENAEHVMLVDLARNDLSRHGHKVQVEAFREVQFFSHVIHLVSKVTAEIAPEQSVLQLVADTFPAGTLSGAPKHRAMQLIEEYEPQNRGFYGGSIGYLGLDGSFNHAIMIRSFCSQQNTLHYQAGAGIVAHSKPAMELQEVDNKLAALRKAIKLAANEGLETPGQQGEKSSHPLSISQS